MPISTKAEYAARAMMQLALVFDGGAGVRTADIAAQQCIPKKYLEQILLQLKHHGLVRSKPGVNGGYSLGRSPREITVAHVLRAVEGPPAPSPCGGADGRTDCRLPAHDGCALRRVWQDVQEAASQVLEGVTLADLAAEARRRTGGALLDYQI